MRQKKNSELDDLTKETIDMEQNEAQVDELSPADANALNEVNEALKTIDDESVDDEGAILVPIDEIEGLDIEEIIQGSEEITDESETIIEESEELEKPVKAGEVLKDDDLQELNLSLDKASSYETQSSGPAIETVERGAGSSAIKKSANTSKKASTPRVPRDLASIDAKHFVLKGDASKMTIQEVANAKAALIAATPKQVKVAEKMENVIQSIAADKKPSKYVMTIFGALDKMKVMTSTEVVAALKTSGVSEGTARSQSGQLMVLFPVLGVAIRDGQTLKLAEDSNIADYLRKAATPTTSA